MGRGGLDKVKNIKLILVVFLISILIYSFSGIILAGNRILEEGMQGRDVRELQEDLVILGNRLIIDGVFGPSTKSTVIEFQRKSKLPADGVVGDKTWDMIEEAMSFDNYKVKRGDTLSGLAKVYGVNVKLIKNANDLDSNLIKVGEELIIPKTALGGAIDTDFYRIISYKVRRGDTLEKLARRYHTTIRTIKKVNNFTNSNIIAGQIIKMPKLVVDLSRSSRNRSRVKKDFIWPVRGRISSNYGWRIHPVLNKRHFHGGIDIAVGSGTSVRAAKAGRVLNSGWIQGFGKTVTIDHSNGVVTLYAHNSKLLVKAGQKVSQGQIISKSGSTGLSTGPHVDFRILINSKTVNPLKYLD